MSEKNHSPEGMLNGAGDFNAFSDGGENAEKGPTPPVKYGHEKMSSKSSWKTSWENMTPFQRQMEIDEQGQDAILNNVEGYVGRM